MSHFAMKQDSFVKCEETGLTFSSSFSDQNIPVVCPKPRRVGRLVGVDPVRPITVVNFSHQLDVCDTSGGADVLEMLLAQDCHSDEDLQWEDSHGSPPPLFYGSPPSRSANPVIHDVRFLEEKASSPLTPLSLLSSSSSSSPSGGSHGGLFRSSSFGPLPAAVRIEGFDCLDQDRRGRSIPAFA